MRTAIVHYWLLNMRGGEKVVEALCRLLPDADIFTLFYEREKISATIRSHQVKTSFLQPFRRHYRSLLPLMPLALESLDLRGYDLVISSESGPAKGVILSAETRHVCYCHTPMRYLWELYPAYRNDWTAPGWKRAAMTALSYKLRLWDFASAARVDEFIANSTNVQRRIMKTYRRPSQVLHPPVDVQNFHHCAAKDYFLIVSELVAYKQVDSAVRVFSRNGWRLRIVGEGPEFKKLAALASSNIEFCGRVPDQELRQLYAECRALIVPGEEDFGMNMVEALASGKPVIALGRGGAIEIVPQNRPFGCLLYSGADAALQDAVQRFERQRIDADPKTLQRYAENFSTAQFMSRMAGVLGLKGQHEDSSCELSLRRRMRGA